MISTTDLAESLGTTRNTIKQALKEFVGEENVIRTKPGTGSIKISASQARSLSISRGFSFQKNIVTIGNQKGGVGKSLLTVNVAVRKAMMGAKVLVIDLDPEASATNFLLKEDEVQEDFPTMLEAFKGEIHFSKIIKESRYENVDIVPCRGKARRAERYTRDTNIAKLMRDKISGLSDIYDLILFEVPPTFSNIISSAYIASDIVIIPTFPDAWSLESVLLTIEDIQEECDKWDINIPEIKVVLNKFNEKRTASKDAYKMVISEFGEYALHFQIKESADLQNAVNDLKTAFEAKCPKVVRESLSLLADIVCPLERAEKNV